MEERITSLVLAHTSLGAAGTIIGTDTDLWAAGMSSVHSVNVMMAVEDEFDIEFPEALLSRATFTSVASIAAAVRTQIDDDTMVSA
ncbi:acyl carrier protein [Nocardia sp. NPDC058114]|uniref:acyl carrier protein n=1 Tax=Nocardia sp. NPDC058114 TaxID=3346346 RepID=UPI0036DAA973